MLAPNVAIATMPLLPQTAGIGLKPEHYAAMLEAHAGGGGVRTHWVEVHPQNFFCSGGPAHRWLTAVASHVPLSFHSTALSLGSAEGLDAWELDQLAALTSRYQPASISDHLSWSNGDGEKFPDLLPIAYTHEALDRFIRHIDIVQERLQRTILIENPSRYLAFARQDMDEIDFLHALCARAGCRLLLDVNNIEVSAANLGFDAAGYIGRIDVGLIGEVHLAGHTTERYDDGTILKIDDHGSAVSDFCWGLYAGLIARSGPLPTLIERDTNVPSYDLLMAEARRADAVLTARHG